MAATVSAYLLAGYEVDHQIAYAYCQRGTPENHGNCNRIRAKIGAGGKAYQSGYYECETCKEENAAAQQSWIYLALFLFNK